MKVVITLAGVSLAAASFLVLAGPGGHAGGFAERLKAADTNGDGMISRSEAQALPFIAKNFDAIDANGDGQITVEELRAFHAKNRGGHNPLKRLDTDGDGKISRAEAQAAPRLAQNFDAIDTNHDGFLTKEELHAYAQQQRQAHWSRIDTDGDGKISRAEAQANAPRLFEHFDQIDTNGDGYITPEELHAAFARHHHGHGDK